MDGGAVRTYTIAPEEFGLARVPLDALRGGTPQENAEICVRVLQGDRGPRRDIVVLNAGVALVAAGIAESMTVKISGMKANMRC
jgi:anthranilate phosphoribosyltransferase